MADPITTKIGDVSAYLDAVAHGFEGTRAEFGELLANSANYAQSAESAASAASAAAATATTKAMEATTAATAAQTAKTQTEAAASQALTDISTAEFGAISAVQTEGATQTANATAQAQAAATSATTASTKASEASASATTATTKATEAAASATSAANAASAAQGVLESIPEDYSDLSEDVDQLKADLADVDDNIYNGYKNVELEWEHGWVNSNGNYDPNSNRYLIEGKSTSEATTVVNNSESTIYVVYFSEYTDLENFTYDSYVAVNAGNARNVDKTKPYFLIESPVTTESELNGVQLGTDTPITYLSKANLDNTLAHKQSIFFAFCSQISWTITDITCALSVNSDIRVRFDVPNAAVDTTKEQLLAIAQASTASITVSDGVISGYSFAVIFDFDTNAIKIVNPAVRSTYVNTVILFYWHYGVLSGVLVNNKTALDVIQNTTDIVDIRSQLWGDGLADYFVTEAETCRNSLIADCGEKAFVIAFSTDNHYGASNGVNFPTTVKTIKKVNNLYQFDIVVCGGDLINGDKPRAEAISLLTDAVNELIKIGRPTYTLIGNHDDDSFTSSEQPLFSRAELYSMMYRHSGINLDYVAESERYGYKDIPQYGLRLIFLDAVYGENGHISSNWGYSDAELAWFTNDALNTDNQVVMFSHMAFTADYMAYGTNVKNGAAMRTAVENFIANGGVVVGLFHAHNHWDYIGQYSQTNGFHEVSTGCGRIISGPDIPYAHPEGAVMPERTVNTVTQELWDIIIIKPESRSVNIIRFGAGDNRNFTY